MEFIYPLIVVTTLGNMEEPMVTSMPVTPFLSEEQCEKRLMTYLSEGFLMSMVNGKLMVSRQTQNSHTHATCVTMVKPE